MKAEQLEGIINLDADFSLEVDPTFHVSQNSLSAIVDLNISNGRLRNFEPFEKISKYAFKNRHLDDVEFAELKQRLHFKGTKMNIELAEINSTAFCLYVEGMYDFNGETDLRIQIPWSNLKKIPEDAILGQPGNDGREARSLFLKAVGPNGKVALSYDKTQGGKKEERKKERKKKKKKTD